MKYYKQILFTLSAGGAALVSVGLLYWLTLVIYSGQSDPEAAKVVFRWRLVVFTALTLLILATAIYLHLSKSASIDSPLGLLFFIPVVAALCFITSIYYVLVIFFTEAAWIIGQYRVILHEDDFERSADAWGGGYKKVATARNISGLLLVLVSIFLWRTAYDWAHTTVQQREIRAKGLYAEVSSLQQLIDHEKVEYVRFSEKKPAAHFPLSERFGSGDDSYSLTYAPLVDSPLEAIFLPRWPVWLLCDDSFCASDQNTIYRVHRCQIEQDCSKEFLKLRQKWLLLYATRGLPQDTGAGAGKIALLLELSPEKKLSYSEDVWRLRVIWGLVALAGVQLFYTFFHFLAMRALRKHLPKNTGT